MNKFPKRSRFIYLLLVIFFIIDLLGVFQYKPKSKDNHSTEQQIVIPDVATPYMFAFQEHPKEHITRMIILIVLILILFIPLEKHTQKQIDERLKSDLKSKRKSEHMTTISHEIRTPLNGIIGALELLRRSDLNSSQKELLELAMQCSDGLLEIIHNILDFSRIESGQMQLTLKKTDLLSILDQAMLTISHKASDKNIQLKMLVTNNFPLKANIDPVRLKQVLVNLLGNSVKFTDSGYILLYADACEQQLKIVVEDSGPGIPQHLHQQIFQPYHQATTDAEGSGLGLAITQTLVKLMAGTIELVSDTGEGARFTITLPTPDEIEQISLPPMEVRAPDQLHPQLALWGLQPISDNESDLHRSDYLYLSGRLFTSLKEKSFKPLDKHCLFQPSSFQWQLKILVVDDIQTNCQIMQKMIEELGHQVFTATSGSMALSLAKRHIFDLVLMDIRMPGLSGLEAVRRWREGPDILDSECYISAVTANTHPSEQQQIKQAGFDGYLTKPLSLSQLEIQIRNATEEQLERGIELVPFPALEKTLLDLNHPEISERLQQDLLCQLGMALECLDRQQKQELMDHLHTIKGSAALGGLNLVSEATEQLEQQQLKGSPLTQNDLLTLKRLIQSV